MLKRDDKTGRLLKQPAKRGDLIVCDVDNIGFTANKAYKVIATQNSFEKNRISFGDAYPREGDNSKGFGVFVIDNDDSKRFVRLGTDAFGVNWMKLP